MKIKNYFLATLLITIMFGCAKENVSKKNMLVFDGKEYDIGNAIFENFGPTDENTFESKIMFISPDINYEEVLNLDFWGYRGKGSFINFWVYSSDPNKLSAGEYKYMSFEQSKGKSNTYDYVNGYLNSNFEKKTVKDFTIGTGSLLVKNSEIDFEITFNGTVNSGKKIEIYYKGSVINYNYKK